jgi:hypothetical protein
VTKFQADLLGIALGLGLIGVWVFLSRPVHNSGKGGRGPREKVAALLRCAADAMDGGAPGGVRSASQELEKAFPRTLNDPIEPF